jgi:hypothetical protein
MQAFLNSVFGKYGRTASDHYRFKSRENGFMYLLDKRLGAEDNKRKSETNKAKVINSIKVTYTN